jgi:hypothetical protein
MKSKKQEAVSRTAVASCAPNRRSPLQVQELNGLEGKDTESILNFARGDHPEGLGQRHSAKNELLRRFG